MKFIKIIFLVSSIIACNSINNEESDNIKVSGFLKVTGITSYQYGEHKLTDKNGKTLYAIKNGNEYKSFLNTKITIEAKLIKGYPLEGGPKYITIEKLK